MGELLGDQSLVFQGLLQTWPDVPAGNALGLWLDDPILILGTDQGLNSKTTGATVRHGSNRMSGLLRVIHVTRLDTRAALLKNLQHRSFAKFRGGGVDDGSECMGIAPFLADDLSKIRFRCFEFDDRYLMSDDLLHYNLVWILRQCSSNHFHKFLDLNVIHEFTPSSQIES